MIDYAWAAGFHEGEGNVSRLKQGGLQASVTQTDTEPLLKLQSLFGGTVNGPYTNKNSTKPFWVWSVCNVKEVTNYVYSILPWLSDRRGSDALNKVEYWHNVYEVKRTFCQKGHNKDVTGRRKTTRGHACQQCIRENKREYYLRSKV